MYLNLTKTQHIQYWGRMPDSWWRWGQSREWMTDRIYLRTTIKESVRCEGILVYRSLVKPWSLSSLFIHIYCCEQQERTTLMVSALSALALYFTYTTKSSTANESQPGKPGFAQDGLVLQGFFSWLALQLQILTPRSSRVSNFKNSNLSKSVQKSLKNAPNKCYLKIQQK